MGLRTSSNDEIHPHSAACPTPTRYVPPASPYRDCLTGPRLLLFPLTCFVLYSHVDPFTPSLCLKSFSDLALALRKKG